MQTNVIAPTIQTKPAFIIEVLLIPSTPYKNKIDIIKPKIYPFKYMSLLSRTIFSYNSLIYSFRILYFDYDNESLELFDELDKPTDFIGYYSAYPKILEAFNQSQDVKRIGTKTIKENEYSNEEEFTEYLDDLITFKYFTVDKYTPKSRIADCLKLGVVPRLSDDTKLLEIEEIAKDKETEWEILSEKCKEYYTNNLSINIIADKLVRTVFNM